MKVLMTADAVGGIAAYAAELQAQLAAEDVEVLVATIGPVQPPDPCWPHRPGRLEWEADPWDDVAAAGRWLLELAAEHRPDLVHLNSFSLAALPWGRPTVVVGHSCVASWHEAVRHAPPGPEFDEYAARVRAGLLAADRVVAPTHAMLASLRRLYGLGSRGGVIYNGIAAAGSGPGTPREPVVLAAGRLWDEAKGLDTLDAAAARSAWPVEVAGPADGVVAGQARLLGTLSRGGLRARMRRAGIFAHPARYEPFGLVVAEAAAEGCALVLGDIPSLRELWDGAALFVAPGDPAALAAALDRVAGDDALRARLAADASARARRYDAATMARRYLRLYRTLRTRVAA
jgi:glycosyltransferase involved in cell wall biosynthesis